MVSCYISKPPSTLMATSDTIEHGYACTGKRDSYIIESGLKDLNKDGHILNRLFSGDHPEDCGHPQGEVRRVFWLAAQPSEDRGDSLAPPGHGRLTREGAI